MDTIRPFSRTVLGISLVVIAVALAGVVTAIASTYHWAIYGHHFPFIAHPDYLFFISFLLGTVTGLGFLYSLEGRRL